MGPYLAQPNTDKKVEKGESFKQKLKFSLCEMQGWRRGMEDAAITQLDLGNGNSLFGVFDGHGGCQVSKFVQKIFVTHLKNCKSYKEERYIDALTETFKKVDQVIESKEGEEELKVIRKKSDVSSYNDNIISLSTGCTANVVLITPSKIYTANAGDSRSVLSRKGNAIALSFDHKPDSEVEKKRIHGAAGEVINGRVNGGLNLSRSFGDFNYKKNKNKLPDEQMIISKPDVSETPRMPGDEFIVMGCDGIWEKYQNDSQNLITRIWNERKSGNEGLTIVKNLVDFLLAKDTSEEVGCDNMTIILIEFI